MGDTYWMEDEVRVDGEEAAVDFNLIFQQMDKPAASYSTSFSDSQVQELISQKAQYPASDTGSQFLDPVYRQNLVKINSGTCKIPLITALKLKPRWKNDSLNNFSIVAY